MSRASAAASNTIALTHYEVLGISQRATTSQINAAYNESIKKYHPDRSSWVPPYLSAQAEMISKRITVAGRCLKDATQKAIYDTRIETLSNTTEDNEFRAVKKILDQIYAERTDPKLLVRDMQAIISQLAQAMPQIDPQELKALREENAKLRHENQTLTTRQRALEAENEKLKKHAGIEAKYQQLQTEHQGLKVKLEQQTADLGEAKNKRAELKALTIALQTENKALRKQIESLTQQMKDLEGRTDATLRSEYQTLKQGYEELQRSTTQRISELGDQVESLLTQSSNATNEKNELQERVNTLEHALETAQIQREQKEAFGNKMSDENHQLKEQIKTQNAEIKTLKAKMSDGDHHKSNLLKRIRELKEQLEATAHQQTQTSSSTTTTDASASAASAAGNTNGIFAGASPSSEKKDTAAPALSQHLILPTPSKVISFIFEQQNSSGKAEKTFNNVYLQFESASEFESFIKRFNSSNARSILIAKVYSDLRYQVSFELTETIHDRNRFIQLNLNHILGTVKYKLLSNILIKYGIDICNIPHHIQLPIEFFRINQIQQNAQSSVKYGERDTIREILLITQSIGLGKKMFDQVIFKFESSAEKTKFCTDYNPQLAKHNFTLTPLPERQFIDTSLLASFEFKGGYLPFVKGEREQYDPITGVFLLQAAQTLFNLKGADIKLSTGDKYNEILIDCPSDNDPTASASASATFKM